MHTITNKLPKQKAKPNANKSRRHERSRKPIARQRSVRNTPSKQEKRSRTYRPLPDAIPLLTGNLQPHKGKILEIILDKKLDILQLMHQHLSSIPEFNDLKLSHSDNPIQAVSHILDNYYQFVTQGYDLYVSYDNKQNPFLNLIHIISETYNTGALIPIQPFYEAFKPYPEYLTTLKHFIANLHNIGIPTWDDTNGQYEIEEAYNAKMTGDHLEDYSWFFEESGQTEESYQDWYEAKNFLWSAMAIADETNPKTLFKLLTQLPYHKECEIYLIWMLQSKHLFDHDFHFRNFIDTPLYDDFDNGECSPYLTFQLIWTNSGFIYDSLCENIDYHANNCGIIPLMAHKTISTENIKETFHHSTEQYFFEWMCLGCSFTH